ncbi:hypothetical protein ACLOJK_041303 [Asimina triloba]
MAADGVKVRVVRCPKCDMLLPEPPNSPVYRCGGCNATLQAKKHLYPKSVAFSEKPNPEKIEMHKNSQRRVVVDSEEARETDEECNGPERMANSDGPSSSGSKELPIDLKDSQGFKSKSSSYDQGRYRRPSKSPMKNWEVVSDLGFTPDRSLERYREGNRFPKAQIETADGSQRRRHIPVTGVSQRTRAAVAEGSAFSQYSDEGSSKYHVDSDHRYGKQVRNPSHPDDPEEFRLLEQDKAEILRQLDELMERISRSSKASPQSTDSVLPSSRRIVAPNPYYNAQDRWSAESSSTASGGHRMQRSAYLNADPVLMMNPHDQDMQNFYLPMHVHNEIPGHREMLGTGMPNRALHAAHDYPDGRLNGYHAGQFVGIDPDLLPFTEHAFYNQPSCSCVHCYRGQWSGAAQVPPATVHNQHMRNTANNGMFYRLDGHGPPLTGDFGLHSANAQVHPHESESHTRVPSVVESEMGYFRKSPAPRGFFAEEKGIDHEPDMGDFRQGNSQKAVLSKVKLRSCQPLAGGAPFITCCNCSELLQLPKKLLVMDKNKKKLRCGACSKVVSYEVKDRRLTFSMPSSPQNPVKEADKPSPTKNAEAEANNASMNVSKEVLLDSDGQYRKTSNAHCYSDDSTNSSCANQSSGTKLVLSPHSSLGDDTKEMNLLLNSKESEKSEEFCSSSMSSDSDDEERLNMIPNPICMPESPDLPLKVERDSTVPGSPLHEHFESSPTNQAVNGFEKCSRSHRFDAEKIFPMKGFSRQGTCKDQSAATETECSYNEYTNSGTSQDSEEIRGAEIRPRFSKGGESFLAGITKNFREFGISNQSLEDGSCSVSVNGHPISDHLVKKAERQAGRIRPGNYWYDYRAGFWGVMGFPCLGVIPPYIEEFSYSMPEDCSGGNTGVFVNGRELHQKDLDLLATRGLPTTSNKSYVVEITGEVYDDATGQVLESLGKLAPTNG